MEPKPFKTGYLPEKDGHKIYFAEYGNPQGEAVVYLHGGPGSKCGPQHAANFELDKYHVITFDQRGCGESLPLGKISHNSTQDSIEDIERLRKELKIDRWFVCGSSWGSTLALAYVETYPKAVKGLLVGSIFLGRSRDEQWAFSQNDGIDRIFPDLWESRLKFLKKYQANSVNAAKVLLAKIEKGQPAKVKEVVAGVRNWEGNLMNAQEDLHFTEPEDVEETHIAEVKVFLHYESNKFFLKENELIKNIAKIKDVPTIIVHGRYDLLCPLEQAWEVKKQLTNAEMVILPTSNHKFTADGAVARKLAFNYFLSKHI